MHSTYRLGTVGLAMMLVGCASPAVKFEPVSPGTPGSVATETDAAAAGAIVINIPISRVLVTPAASRGDQGGKAVATAGTLTVTGAGGGTYSVSVLPSESGAIYRVMPVNGFWSSNALGVTKIDNTDIPKSVQNTFTDQTVKRIGEIGQLITSGLTLAAMVSGGRDEAQCAKEKTAPDFAFDVTADTFGTAAVVNPADTCWSYDVERRATGHAAATISRADFRTAIATGAEKGVWPVTAFTDAVVTVFKTGHADTPEFEITAKVIDPDVVRLMAVPSKGSITMHSVCGGEFTYAPIDDWGNGFDALSALMTQSQAIIKTKKK
jgi:hypothetical protein